MRNWTNWTNLRQIQIRGPNIPDQGSAHELKDLHLRMAFQCLKDRKLHSITIKSKDYSFGCGRGHWWWVLCCPDSWYHLKHLEVCRLKINYTNTTLYQSVPHKYSTRKSYDEGKHSPHIESLAMTYWIYVAQTCFLFTNKPTLHRKLFALIKMLCFFRKKERSGSHDSRLQQKQRVLSCRETKAPWVTEIKETSKTKQNKTIE